MRALIGAARRYASTQAYRAPAHGGPEVLSSETVALPAPAANEALVRNRAVGLNYIDTYHRSGLYPLTMPTGSGLEGAGVVEAVGDGCSGFAVGDRVAYCTGPLGAYAEACVVPESKLLRLPDSVSFETAAAVLLKGMTVEYLLERCSPVKRGDTILFHAAAGGTGLLAGQWAKALGATVIGTAGGAEKCALAQAAGYDHVIDYTVDDVPARVRELTGGQGVPAVFDSVGAATWEASLASLSPRGMMVSFGAASGPVEGVAVSTLAAKGSIFLTRPTLFTYCASRDELGASASRVFEMLASGKVAVRINQTYELADAQQAHRDLESRKLTGATVFRMPG